MTVTVIFLRYEVKDSEKIRHFETTPFSLCRNAIFCHRKKGDYKKGASQMNGDAPYF